MPVTMDETDVTFVDTFSNSLPHEIREEVFSYLTAKELCNVSFVSKSWREQANTDHLW